MHSGSHRKGSECSALGSPWHDLRRALLLMSIAALGYCSAVRGAGETSAGQVRVMAASIDSIIYSERTPEAMRRELQPYLRKLETLEMFKGVAGAAPHLEIGSGPGFRTLTFPYSGLQLGYDPGGRLQMVRRAHRVIGKTGYAPMSIGERGTTKDGYSYWFSN